MKISRRHFVKSGLLGGIGVAGLTGIYTWQVEPFWVDYVSMAMPIYNLPSHLIGKTLVQISDIHVGDRFDYSYIIDTLKKVQTMHPDYVVYTGDFVSYDGPRQLDQLKNVLQYAAKGSIGTAAILGNHDYGHNWSDLKVANAITAQLAASGIDTLRNQSKNMGGLELIGLDDYWGPNFAPQEVLEHHDPTRATIVLCHNPDVCDLNVWSNYQGWILAGHTHGGQCKPPFLPPPMLPVKNKRYSSGLIDLKDGRTLYINRALGHLWQVRFNVRPEITIFKLQQA